MLLNDLDPNVAAVIAQLTRCINAMLEQHRRCNISGYLRQMITAIIIIIIMFYTIDQATQFIL